MVELDRNAWEERNRLLGRIVEELAGITDPELLNETLVHAKKQKGRQIGRTIKRNKARTEPLVEDADPNDLLEI